MLACPTGGVDQYFNGLLSRRERLTNAERRLGEGASVTKHTPYSLFGLRLGHLEFGPRDKTVSMSQLAYTVSDLRAEPIDALKAAGKWDPATLLA